MLGIIVIGCVCVLVWRISKLVEKINEKGIQDHRNWEQERRAVLSMNYREIAEKETIGSFEEEIACRLDIISNKKNENKYRESKKSSRYATHWDERKEELEKIILYLNQHAELSKHINEALYCFVKGWYDECSSHLRKAIRWMVLTKVDAEQIIFTGDTVPTIGELIERFYGKDGIWSYHDNMQFINRVGNNASHAFVQQDTYYTPSFDNCCRLFYQIENVIPFFFSDYKVQRYFATADTDVRKYIKNFDELICDEKYDDAAINVRRTLELVARKYFDKYAIRCLCGHSKDLCGYIDLLHEKQYISEESKTNMHEIRYTTNDGAHEENQTYRLTKEKVIRCYEMIKKEIEILESIN